MEDRRGYDGWTMRDETKWKAREEGRKADWGVKWEERIAIDGFREESVRQI